MTKLVRSVSFPLLLATLAAAAASLDSPNTVLRIDPAQTTVEFALGDVLHTVRGTFRLKRGEISFDAVSGRAGGEKKSREREQRNGRQCGVGGERIMFQRDGGDGRAAGPE